MPRLDPQRIRLRCQPWRVSQTFSPLEQAIGKIERDGSIECALGEPVCDVAGEWIEIAEAIAGIIEFFDLVAQRNKIELDVTGLRQLSGKLKFGTPLVENDLFRARTCIAQLKQFALNQLTVGEAESALRVVKIRWAMEDAELANSRKTHRSAAQ